MNPILTLLLLFVGIPLFELYLMIEIGSGIGAIPTVFLAVFTAVLGGLMVRVQGFSTIAEVQQAMARDEVPAVEMLGGVVLLLAGLLLLLPGFVTDAIGFLCLVPAVRRFLVLSFLRRAKVMRSVSESPRPAAARRRIIEGEYRRDDR